MSDETFMVPRFRSLRKKWHQDALNDIRRFWPERHTGWRHYLRRRIHEAKYYRDYRFPLERNFLDPLRKYLMLP